MLKKALKSLTSREHCDRRPAATRTLAFETLQRRELMSADLGLADLAEADTPVEAAAAELAEADTPIETAAAQDQSRGYSYIWIDGERWYHIKGGSTNDHYKIVGEKLYYRTSTAGKWNFRTTLPSSSTIKGILIDGGGGDDTVTIEKWSIGNKALVFNGEGGDDKFENKTGHAVTVDGGAGEDTIMGGSGDDELYGGDGNDRIYGGRGADVLCGNNGNDKLYQNNEANDNDWASDEMYGGDENGSTDKYDHAWGYDKGRDSMQDIHKDHQHWRPSFARASEQAEVEPVSVSEECGNASEEVLDQNEPFSHDAYFAAVGEEEDASVHEQEASRPGAQVVDVLMSDVLLFV